MTQCWGEPSCEPNAAGEGGPDGPDGEHGDAVPLVALLARAERRFIEEFDTRIRATDFCALSLAHSRNVLRHLGGGPMRASQIVERCDVTKQAVSQQIVHLERNGYLTSEPDPSDQRARVLRLTAKGEAAQRVVKQLFAEIEADWARLVEPGQLGIVREVLSTLVDKPGS